MRLRQAGQGYSYLYDGKGNVISVIDCSQSTVAGCRYDAFGKLMAESGTLDQPFMFSAKRYDAGTGPGKCECLCTVALCIRIEHPFKQVTFCLTYLLNCLTGK